MAAKWDWDESRRRKEEGLSGMFSFKKYDFQGVGEGKVVIICSGAGEVLDQAGRSNWFQIVVSRPKRW